MLFDKHLLDTSTNQSNQEVDALIYQSNRALKLVQYQCYGFCFLFSCFFFELLILDLFHVTDEFIGSSFIFY